MCCSHWLVRRCALRVRCSSHTKASVAPPHCASRLTERACSLNATIGEKSSSLGWELRILMPHSHFSKRCKASFQERPSGLCAPHSHSCTTCSDSPLPTSDVETKKWIMPPLLSHNVCGTICCYAQNCPPIAAGVSWARRISTALLRYSQQMPTPL